MMSGPKGPCFVTGPGGYFAWEPDSHSETRATLLGVLKGFFQDSTVYDSRGTKWRAKGIKSRYARTWWWMLLANTVYNPKVSPAF